MFSSLSPWIISLSKIQRYQFYKGNYFIINASSCTRVSVTRGFGTNIVFQIFWGWVRGDTAGNEKVCVTNWGKGQRGKLCADKERRGDEGTAEKENCKNAELKGLEAQNQHLCKHSKMLGTHTHTPEHKYAVLLQHCHEYLPYQDVILGRVGSWNSNSLLRCEAITWSTRARLITWTGSATSHFLLRSSRITRVGHFTTPSWQRPFPTLIQHTQTHTNLTLVFAFANFLTFNKAFHKAFTKCCQRSVGYKPLSLFYSAVFGCLFLLICLNSCEGLSKSTSRLIYCLGGWAHICLFLKQNSHPRSRSKSSVHKRLQHHTEVFV